MTVPGIGGGTWLGVLAGDERAGCAGRGGFGGAGGDIGCPGEDLGEQVQQVCSFVVGEGG